MSARTAAIIVTALDCAAFAAVAAGLFWSGSDAATRGFDLLGIAVVSIVFAVTVLPALVLLYLNRAPRAALAFALALPAAFVAAFVAVVIAFM